MAERGLPEQLRADDKLDQPATDLRLSETTRTDGLHTQEERNAEPTQKRTANRGFAAMDREKQKRIASEGGRAAHRQGVAHEWNRDEAREAGRKGGQIVSQNRDHMSEIGRKGGQNSGNRRQQTEE